MSPPIGYKQSPEHRTRVGAASRARWATLGFRQKMLAAGHYPRPPMSDETRAKISAARKAQPAHHWLPEMTRRQRLDYRKFTRLGYSRADALEQMALCNPGIAAERSVGADAPTPPEASA